MGTFDLDETEELELFKFVLLFVIPFWPLDLKDSPFSKFDPDWAWIGDGLDDVAEGGGVRLRDGNALLLIIKSRSPIFNHLCLCRTKKKALVLPSNFHRKFLGRLPHKSLLHVTAFDAEYMLIC